MRVRNEERTGEDPSGSYTERNPPKDKCQPEEFKEHQEKNSGREEKIHSP